MEGDDSATTVPALLATQLLAAEVYADFYRLSSDGEAWLWKKMLDDELDHITHLRTMLAEPPSGIQGMPPVNVPRVRATCDQVRLHGSGSFLLRLEGALRLECAELDYGLEGLAARRLTRDRPLAEYAEEIIDHVRYLLREAKRYAQSANIGLQRRRLAELLETSLSSPTTIIERPSTRLLL